MATLLEVEDVALLETELKFDMNFITTTQATTRKAAERAAATGFPLLKILSFPTCYILAQCLLHIWVEKSQKMLKIATFNPIFFHNLQYCRKVKTSKASRCLKYE